MANANFQSSDSKNADVATVATIATSRNETRENLLPSQAAQNRTMQETRLLMLSVVLALGLCIGLAYRNTQARAELADRAARAACLADDMRVIRRLRDCPQTKTDLSAGTRDVLDAVMAAMQSAGLDAKTLVSTQPQAPRPIPGTAIADVEYRLIFNDVPLEAFARFAQACQEGRGFRTTSVVLRAAPENRWNADLALATRAFAEVPATSR